MPDFKKTNRKINPPLFFFSLPPCRIMPLPSAIKIPPFLKVILKKSDFLPQKNRFF